MRHQEKKNQGDKDHTDEKHGENILEKFLGLGGDFAARHSGGNKRNEDGNGSERSDADKNQIRHPEGRVIGVERSSRADEMGNGAVAEEREDL